MKLGPKYDPKEIESEINSYLERIDQRSLIENELLSSEKIGYVEGPPTLNGEPHIGHLRGRIIKDLCTDTRPCKKIEWNFEQDGTLKVCQLNYRQKRI